MMAKKKSKEQAPTALESNNQEAASWPGPQRRSLSVELFCAGETEEAQRSTYRQVVQSIRHYRAVLRQCFSALACAQAAGADIEWTGEGDDAEVRIKPNNAAARAVLAQTFGDDGKLLAYQLRTYVRTVLATSWYSFVWDSLRRDLQTAWTAKDPEFTKASRGWLILQGGRSFNQFNRRGIGHPSGANQPKLVGHTLTFKWDHTIGPVTFKLKKMDGGRYHVWRALRDGDEGWSVGTVYLTEREGKRSGGRKGKRSGSTLHAVITYTKPASIADVDPARVCTVTVRSKSTSGSLFDVSGPDGIATVDTIAIDEVVAWLRRQENRKQALEKRRAACGSPRRPWGHRHAWRANQDVLTNQTVQRDKGVADRNHAWARRLASRAVAWRCGTVQLVDMPEETLSGWSWSWTGFKHDLKYKLEELGIKLVITKEAQQDDTQQSVSDTDAEPAAE